MYCPLCCWEYDFTRAHKWWTTLNRSYREHKIKKSEKEITGSRDRFLNFNLHRFHRNNTVTSPSNKTLFRGEECNIMNEKLLNIFRRNISNIRRLKFFYIATFNIIWNPIIIYYSETITYLCLILKIFLMD